ncbi:Vps51/Vps67-domain-containing protein [Hyaloraphidium curvatum]|nr:Vps51/Vps67-domain-containing protein [Hyaloraphidium curvatum]
MVPRFRARFRAADGASFEPDRYVAKFLQEADVVQLIQKDNDLITAVKTLDGEMKTLVYENYNKFITATDTIRKMKDTVDSMDAEMDGLMRQVQTIGTKADLLNEALGERRQEVRRLTGVHSVLRKLQFILELPDTLREALAKKQLPQAVRHYAQTSKIMEQYSDLAVFKSIESECKNIMKGAAASLEAQLASASSASSVVQAVELLLGLGRTPREMWKAMLETSHRYLKQVKQSCTSSIASMQAGGRGNRSPDSVPGQDPAGQAAGPASMADLVDVVNQRYLSDFGTLVAGFEDLFLATDVPQAGASGAAQPEKPRKSDKLAPRLDLDKRRDALLDLKLSVPGLVSDFISMVSSCTEARPGVPEIPPAELDAALTALHSAVGAQPALCRLVELDDHVRRFSMGKLRKSANAVLARATTDVLSRFGPVLSQDRMPPAELVRLVNEIVAWLDFELSTRCLTYMSAFVTEGTGRYLPAVADGRVEYLETIRVELRLFWQDLLQRLRDLGVSRGDSDDRTEASGSEEPSPALALATCRFCADLPVSAIYGNFAKRLWDTAADAPSESRKPRKLGGSSPADDFLLDAVDVSKSVRAEAEELAAVYTRSAAEGVLSSLRTEFSLLTDWMRSEPVAKVSDGVAALLNGLRAVHGEISAVFGQVPRTAQARAPAPLSSKSAHASTASLRPASGKIAAVDRLFAETEEWYSVSLPLKAPVLMDAVVKIALKVFLELVRIQTFSNDGFQQVQLDVEVCRTTLWPYVTDQRALGALADELVSSAASRTAGPAQSLDRTKLDRFLALFERELGDPQ